MSKVPMQRDVTKQIVKAGIGLVFSIAATWTIKKSKVDFRIDSFFDKRDAKNSTEDN
jgi:hypothetical protein